ncbi:MAG TPA: ATP-binding protein [Actinomycetota bacterium]|nr:ATP-binding protein [Actinomycetota bacterium]
MASLAAVTGTTQRSEDVVNDPRSESGEFSQGAESLLEYGTRAVLAAPLKRGEEVTGVVVFHSSRPRKWSDSEVLLIEEAAKEAASALHNARLYRAAVDTAERLEELDCLRRNFLSMVSHELRSPMAVIAGISDVLSRTAGTEGDERQRRLIDTLGRESRRLARLVSEVLDLEAIEQRRLPIELQPTDLLGLAEEAAADSGEDHRVVVRCDASEAVVEADRDRIKQVLLNLLSNAIKYSPPERPVRIEIRPFLGEGQEQGEVTVAVVDEGPGIPGSEMGRVFEPFTRLSSASRQPGWGLGLYLTRMIVGLHGGRIWVESEPGRGSTFLFSLPRGPRRPAEEPS